MDYFNFTRHVADSWWERRTFVHQWWRLHRDDARWTPPHYPTLRRILVQGQSAYLTPLQPILFHMEALARRPPRPGEQARPYFGGALMEEAVAATVLWTDPRRTRGVANLGLLHCVNHVETMERFWAELQEPMSVLGCSTARCPTALAPLLPGGVLQNYFHLPPPLHTPYNPPYLPELLESVFEPVGETVLYHAPMTATATARGPVSTISPFAPGRLAEDLLPLLAAALPAEAPPPSAEEVRFALDWLGIAPLYGWLARVDGEPVGFLLLQPDMGRAVRQASGGRNWAGQGWLAWRRRRPVQAGRLLYGGVLPVWRQRGIGQQLWRQAIEVGRALGWHSLVVGPTARGSAAAHFLQRQGAEARQRYLLYGTD
jgi:ribosomal protein S18 acetylase RimI-like enzyme